MCVSAMVKVAHFALSIKVADACSDRDNALFPCASTSVKVAGFSLISVTTLMVKVVFAASLCPVVGFRIVLPTSSVKHWNKTI